MKVISIHSHDGGVGKTSLTVSLAAALAQTKKVCIIETNAGRPGLERRLNFEHPKKHLNDYILEPPKNMSLEDILARYEGNDLPPEHLSAIFCSTDRRLIDKLLINAENERRHGLIRSSLWRLLEELEADEKRKADWYLFDCSPGMDGASLATLAVTLKAKGVAILVSTADRPHILGTLDVLSAFLTEKLLEPERLVLIMDRIKPDEEELYRNVYTLFDKIDSDKILTTKVRDIIRTYITNEQYFVVRENKDWRLRFHIGSDGKARTAYDEGADISRITQAIRNLF